MIYKKRIGVPIYDGVVNVVFADSAEEAAGAMPKDIGKSLLAGSPVDGSTIYSGKYFWVYYEVDVKVNILTHEVFHVTELLLDYVGMSLTNESSEAYAYLNGYLNSEIVKFYWKVQDEKKNKEQEH